MNIYKHPHLQNFANSAVINVLAAFNRLMTRTPQWLSRIDGAQNTRIVHLEGETPMLTP